MYTCPDHDDVLEGVIISLQKDVLPFLTNEKAQVTVVMMQAMLQMLRQLVPVHQQKMAREHNEMTAVFRDVAVVIGASPEPEADRIRGRAATLGGRPDFPEIPAFDDLSQAHRALSDALVETIKDLDAVIRGGNAAGEDALARIRAHLGPRVASDFSTMVVGAGMVGRG